MKMGVFEMVMCATFHTTCRPNTFTVGPPFRDISTAERQLPKCPHKQKFRKARNTEFRYFILETSISNLPMTSIQIGHLPNGVNLLV